MQCSAGVRVVEAGRSPKVCPSLEKFGNQMRLVVLSGGTEQVDAAVSGQGEMSLESAHDRRHPCGNSSIHNSNDEDKLLLSSQSRAANHSDQKKPEPKQPARFSVNPPPPPPPPPPPLVGKVGHGSEKVGEKGRFRDACEGGGAEGEKLKDENETCILTLEKDDLVEHVPERKSCGSVKQQEILRTSASDGGSAANTPRASVPGQVLSGGGGEPTCLLSAGGAGGDAAAAAAPPRAIGVGRGGLGAAAGLTEVCVCVCVGVHI
jgi:hypothetical protein